MFVCFFFPVWMEVMYPFLGVRNLAGYTVDYLEELFK